MSTTRVHYYTKAGVACGESWHYVTEVTESFGLVTCFACRKTAVFKAGQIGTGGRPSVPSSRAKLREIRQVLAEWERGVHSDADALSLTINIIRKESPDGQEQGQGPDL